MRLSLLQFYYYHMTITLLLFFFYFLSLVEGNVSFEVLIKVYWLYIWKPHFNLQAFLCLTLDYKSLTLHRHRHTIAVAALIFHEHTVRSMALLNPNAPAFFPHQAPPFIPHQAPPFFPHLYYHQNTHLISSEAKEEQHAHGTLEPGKQQQQLKELHDGHNKQRHFFKFINCNHHSYEWRKKGKQVGRKIFRQSNNNDHHHFLEALPNKSIQRYPLMPVRPDGDQTTVMIRNIPSKYT